MKQIYIENPQLQDLRHRHCGQAEDTKYETEEKTFTRDCYGM